jgi:hypothetical protein
VLKNSYRKVINHRGNMGTKSYENEEEVSVISFRLLVIVVRHKKEIVKGLHAVLTVP